MSTNLKVLALASAAMLALPAVGHAANLDIVGNDLGGWTVEGSGFTSVTITNVGTTTFTGTAPFASGSYGTTFSFSAVAADPGGAPASSVEYVVSSGPPGLIVADLSSSTTFSSTVATVTGTFKIGGIGGSASGSNVVAPGGTLTFALDGGGGTLTGEINASAIPEPASMALFGTGLLGLGTIVRRRRSNAGPASETPQSDSPEDEALTS
jgi:hypothetical protein